MPSGYVRVKCAEDNVVFQVTAISGNDYGSPVYMPGATTAWRVNKEAGLDTVISVTNRNDHDVSVNVKIGAPQQVDTDVQVPAFSMLDIPMSQFV